MDQQLQLVKWKCNALRPKDALQIALIGRWFRGMFPCEWWMTHSNVTVNAGSYAYLISWSLLAIPNPDKCTLLHPFNPLELERQFSKYIITIIVHFFFSFYNDLRSVADGWTCLLQSDDINYKGLLYICMYVYVYKWNLYLNICMYGVFKMEYVHGQRRPNSTTRFGPQIDHKGSHLTLNFLSPSMSPELIIKGLHRKWLMPLKLHHPPLSSSLTSFTICFRNLLVKIDTMILSSIWESFFLWYILS